MFVPIRSPQSHSTTDSTHPTFRDSGYALRRLASGHHGFGSDLPPVDSTLELEDAHEGAIPSLNLDRRTRRSWSPDSVSVSPRSPLSETTTPPSEAEDPFLSDSDPYSSTSEATSPPSSVEGSPRLLPSHLNKTGRHFSGAVDEGKLPFFDLLVVLSRLYEAHFNLGRRPSTCCVPYPFSDPSPGRLPLHPVDGRPVLQPRVRAFAVSAQQQANTLVLTSVLSHRLWKLRPSYTADPGAIPRSAMLATTVSSHLGTVALLCTIAIFYYYERFHHISEYFSIEFVPRYER